MIDRSGDGFFLCAPAPSLTGALAPTLGTVAVDMFCSSALLEYGTSVGFDRAEGIAEGFFDYQMLCTVSGYPSSDCRASIVGSIFARLADITHCVARDRNDARN